jgi:phosphatidylserine decarboxylase
VEFNLIAKGGINIIMGSFAIFFIFLIVWIFYRNSFMMVAVIIVGVFFLFNLYFFRDPNRATPEDPRAIISSGDGKVVQIVEEFEPNYFHDRVWRVSIFLSVFDVHVNRIPISGTVNYIRFVPGKYLLAFKEKASLENEQTAIGITNESGYQVMFKQIAGIIARRIVCGLVEGQTVKAGDRMGLIRYGSRIDMLFPLSAKILVDEGQKVFGGETIIATFSDDNPKTFQEVEIDEVPELAG